MSHFMWNNLYHLKGWYKFGNKIKLLFFRLKVINFKKNTIFCVISLLCERFDKYAPVQSSKNIKIALSNFRTLQLKVIKSIME